MGGKWERAKGKGDGTMKRGMGGKENRRKVVKHT
jgi:hypothetical protein